MWSGMRIYVYSEPINMHRSYDGLAALVSGELGRDPRCGDAFVFFNRRGNQVKVLYFDGSGYCVWSKRLLRGRFKLLARGVVEDGSVEVSEAELREVVEGGKNQ